MFVQASKCHAVEFALEWNLELRENFIFQLKQGFKTAKQNSAPKNVPMVTIVYFP